MAGPTLRPTQKTPKPNKRTEDDMAYETVKKAIEELKRAINEGEHNCDVQTEDLGDMKEVMFFLDTDPADGEPVATITVTPVPQDG